MRYEIETYAAAHGFAVPDFPVFDEAAAGRHFAALRSMPYLLAVDVFSGDGRVMEYDNLVVSISRASGGAWRLGRAARRHINRPRTRPAGRPGAPLYSRGNLYCGSLFGHRAGRYDRAGHQMARRAILSADGAPVSPALSSTALSGAGARRGRIEIRIVDSEDVARSEIFVGRG